MAGPVVAAAVVLPVASIKYQVLWKGVKDSKQLTPQQREELEPVIKQNSLAWGLGLVEHTEIDKINIHKASLLAMKKAVENLLWSYSAELDHSREGEKSFKSNSRGILRSAVDGGPQLLIAIDGKFTVPGITHPQEAIVGGDNKVLSIAAASIIAKVYRDNLMKELHQEFPAYNFAKHKGYATLHHREMIIEHGLSPIHRLSFCGNFV